MRTFNSQNPGRAARELCASVSPSVSACQSHPSPPTTAPPTPPLPTTVPPPPSGGDRRAACFLEKWLPDSPGRPPLPRITSALLERGRPELNSPSALNDPADAEYK